MPAPAFTGIAAQEVEAVLCVFSTREAGDLPETYTIQLAVYADLIEGNLFGLYGQPGPDRIVLASASARPC